MRWAVMHKDGTLTGPYSYQGFYHMCPGAVEWQDHLASMVARLLRETGADAVRLDSLGFYYLPCYNPAHEHATPFGYNDWIKQLLAKVRKAAIAVNPDVLLLDRRAGRLVWSLVPWRPNQPLPSRSLDDAPGRRAVSDVRLRHGCALGLVVGLSGRGLRWVRHPYGRIGTGCARASRRTRPSFGVTWPTKTRSRPIRKSSRDALRGMATGPWSLRARRARTRWSGHEAPGFPSGGGNTR